MTLWHAAMVVSWWAVAWVVWSIAGKRMDGEAVILLLMASTAVGALSFLLISSL